MFNLLDEAIRGTIRFVFGYVYSTAILLWRPFKGPPELFARNQNSSQEQLSSITYVAISILISTAVLLDPWVAGADGPVGFFSGLARSIARGEMNGFWALVGGTVAGTMFLAAALRAAARVAGIAGDKREEFIATGEYLSGVLVLGFALLALPLNLLDYLGDTIFFVSTDTLVILLLIVLMIMFILVPGAATAIHLVDRLRDSDRGRNWTLRFLATAKTLARHPIQATRDLNELTWEFYGIEPSQRRSFTFRPKMALFALMAYALVLLPMGLVGVAIFGGVTATGWLLGGEKVEKIRVMGLECSSDGSTATARAVAWNGSDEPQAGWLPRSVRLELILADEKDSYREDTGAWAPVAANGRTDFLAPKQSLEIGGPVALPKEAESALAGGAVLGCAASALDIPL